MRRLALASVMLTQWACASAGHKAVFYRASATYSVPLDVSRVDRIVVRSSLRQEQLNVLSSRAEGRVSGTMEYSIQGYHGTRKDAGVRPVPPSATVFDQERAGATLTLTSREWVHIHHSMLHTKVTIFIPAGVVVVAQPYSYADLEK